MNNTSVSSSENCLLFCDLSCPRLVRLHNDALWSAANMTVILRKETRQPARDYQEDLLVPLQRSGQRRFLNGVPSRWKCGNRRTTVPITCGVNSRNNRSTEIRPMFLSL